MTTTALPGVTPARPSYPGGADRHAPIVPSVLIIGERKAYYAPPMITRALAIYDTPTTVRVRLPDGRTATEHQHKTWAIPDDAAWAEVGAAVAAFGARLAELADVLRRLGRYAERLTAAGGLTVAANPLCPSVARIEDPDAREVTTWWLSAWHVPRLERAPIARHTPKMLSGAGVGGYVFAQADCFVLADDADWDAVSAAHQAAASAARAAEQLLDRLGTYEEALDGRHAARVVSAAPANDLAVVEPAVTGIVVLSRDEARAAADAIVAAVEDLRSKIDAFDQGRGWQVLGYDSFRAWAVAEIPDTSLRHVYRLRDAAQVDRDLGVTIGHTPESHARELASVPAEERAATMERADARAQEAGRERQARDVKEAAQERTQPSSRPAAPAGWVWASVAQGYELYRLTDRARTRNWASPQGALDEAAARTGRVVIAPSPAGAPGEYAYQHQPSGAILAYGDDEGMMRFGLDFLDGSHPGAERIDWAFADALPPATAQQARAVCADLVRSGRLIALGPALDTLEAPALDTAPPAPEAYAHGEDADGDPVVMIVRDGLHPATADAITAVAVALRAMALGAPVDTAALDDLVQRLADAPAAGRETLIAVLAEIASDADILAERSSAR